MGSHPADTTPGGRGKCPVCGRPSEQRYTPFCSGRCADVDLARWLRGAYAIADDESEDGDAPAGDRSDEKP
ncbi:MAG TPA: DNA gyrase inhibitor YacG [Hyphomicrobiaceae bacterium]|nr:DNA gyrase inhibitor YacG [Hyphomicrobiaceae bacterium]